MKSILVVYGTTDGHTAKIAAFMGDVLRQSGARVDVMRPGGAIDPSAVAYDGIVVAGSLHAGGYQRALRRWLQHHAAELQGKPTAMISVCLGILERDPAVWADLDAKLNRLLDAVGWKPGVVRIVAGAIPYSRYSWLKRRIMQYMTRKAGVITDPARDYEYTDWEDLRLFVGGYLRRVADPQPAPACCVSGSDRTLAAAG